MCLWSSSEEHFLSACKDSDFNSIIYIFVIIFVWCKFFYFSQHLPHKFGFNLILSAEQWISSFNSLAITWINIKKLLLNKPSHLTHAEMLENGKSWTKLGQHSPNVCLLTGLCGVFFILHVYWVTLIEG